MHHNIEGSKWHGHDYRVGYSPAGTVRIYGDSKTGYTLTFGHSKRNHEQGTAGKPIPGDFRTLRDVSKFLETLKEHAQ